ncbi:MAG: HlyD family efflux transporter periplasmic adaptor subunit [Chloroflexi bacterium]|nr:HlyD family efflux transporter periplasmic adaptor subunit [Chloroflexota bacterium]
MFKRRMVVLWLVGLVGALVMAGCLARSSAQGEASPTAMPQVRKSSAGTVSAEAVLVPYRQANLSFKAIGRVQKVLVAVGDQVTAGQELARLDTRDLEQAVLEAEARLKQAQAELSKVQAGPLAEEIAAAEAAVAIAEAEAKAAESAVEVARGQLAAASALLSNAEAGVSSAQIAVRVAQATVAAEQAALRSAQASLDDLVAGPTELELQIARKQVEQAENELWGYQGQRDALGGEGGNTAQYEAAKGQVGAAGTRVEIANLQLQKLMAGASAEERAIAEAAVVQAQANVQIAQAQLQQAQADIESSRSKVMEARANVQTMEGQLAQAIAQHETALAHVQQAKAEANLIKAGTRAEDIAIAEAAVAQAEAALMAARNAMQDAVLVAPYDGTVGEILVQEGELASAEIVAVRLGDLTRLRVRTEDLSEVDINQVRVGQKAKITIDALPGKTFTGSVSQVGLMAMDYRGDRVYTAVLDLEFKPEDGLRWGMTAFTEIQTR